MINRLISLFLIILLGLPILAQDYYQKNFTKEDGLPGSEIYDILQDRNGYIWMGTSYGVCRYDGYEFTTYTTTNGLADNSTITLMEDYKGRIWFSSYSGKLSYYENNQFHSYKYNDTLLKYTKGFVQLFIDTADNLYFTPNSHRHSNIKVTPQGEFIEEAGLPKDDMSGEFSLCFKPRSFGVEWKSFDNDNKLFENNEVVKMDSVFYVRFNGTILGHFLFGRQLT